MELKSRCTLASLVRLWRSNRTFMELKWSTRKHIVVTQIGSNRTFMELKYNKLIKLTTQNTF